jgi:hypothetical protein
MKLTLDVNGRLAVPHIWTEKGDMNEQALGYSITRKVDLSKSEVEKIEYNPLNRQVLPETNFKREFDFSLEEFQLLKDRYLHYSEKKEVTQHTISLFLAIREQMEKQASKKK